MRFESHQKSSRTIRSVYRRPSWIGMLAAVVGFALTGCSMFTTEAEKAKPGALDKAIGRAEKEVTDTLDKMAPPKDVRFDGGLLLGKTDNLAYTPMELAKVLGDLLDKDKWMTARGIVALYPDIIYRILLGEGSGSLSRKQLVGIADLFDKKWGQAGTSNWLSFVNSIDSPSVTQLLDQRRQFLQLISNNQPQEALKFKLVRESQSDSSRILLAESYRLEGIAYLMMEDFERSIERLESAVLELDKTIPWHASQISLLLGEAQRHAKRHDDWKTTWERAIDTQSRWLASHKLTNPAFWSKAAFLRPVSTPWSTTTIRRLQTALKSENLEFDSDHPDGDEAIIWATIGVQSLRRHEAQNAILAFKKSEAIAGGFSLKQELQLLQALAMIDAGQPGPASAIVLRLSSNQNLMADRAKAVLATLKLQNGSLAQGMNLLQAAIQSSKQWPISERLRAEADYGLAYLMRGREEQGISLLNQVYEQFRANEEYDQAEQCLWNIATYYEQTDQTREYRKTIDRLKRLEAR